MVLGIECRLSKLTTQSVGSPSAVVSSNSDTRPRTGGQHGDDGVRVTGEADCWQPIEAARKEIPPFCSQR